MVNDNINKRHRDKTKERNIHALQYVLYKSGNTKHEVSHMQGVAPLTNELLDEYGSEDANTKCRICMGLYPQLLNDNDLTQMSHMWNKTHPWNYNPW